MVAQNSLDFLREIAALKKQMQQAKAATPANQADRADVSSLCLYCSHEGHSKDQCKKKKKDEQKGVFRSTHIGFKNRSKPRHQKKAGGHTDQTSATAIAEVAQPRQPTTEEMAATYWQHYAAQFLQNMLAHSLYPITHLTLLPRNPFTSDTKS